MHDSAAKAVLFVPLGVLAVGEVIINSRSRTGLRKSEDQGTYWIWILLYGAGVVLAIEASQNVESATISGGWAPVILGTALVCAGIALRWWGVITLGRFFQVVVVIQEGHKLMQNGPYRFIRHPGYTGALLIALGIGIGRDNWLSVAATIVFPLAAVLIRTRVEERVLARRFGDEYEAYAARTPRFIPRVW